MENADDDSGGDGERYQRWPLVCQPGITGLTQSLLPAAGSEQEDKEGPGDEKSSWGKLLPHSTQGLNPLCLNLSSGVGAEVEKGGGCVFGEKSGWKEFGK